MTPTQKQKLSRFLFLRMKIRKWTEADLASACDVSKADIVRVMNGRARASLYESVARFLDITYTLRGTDDVTALPVDGKQNAESHARWCARQLGMDYATFLSLAASDYYEKNKKE